MINKLIAILFFSIIISACNNQSGYEYMPNMYRSPSLETYSTNTYFKDSINARLPVEGTIARNYLSTFYFDGDLEGYLQSGKFAKNPYMCIYICIYVIILVYDDLSCVFNMCEIPNSKI